MWSRVSSDQPTCDWRQLVYPGDRRALKDPTRRSDSLAQLVSKLNVRSFAGYLKFAQGWLNWDGHEARVGLAEVSEGIAYCRGLGIHMCLPQFEAELAQAEAQAGQIDAAMARLKQVHDEVELTGERWCEAELHRIRGEILFKRDPANTVPAEEALFTAIGIAQQQEAKSFELRAALSLAKLYQSTGRATDAPAALIPALEGFSPTPEFPEIEEAQAMLATLPS